MFARLNERVKKLNVIDIKLVKLSVFFATIIIVKIFPQLLKISYPALVILVVALALKPLYVFWVKK